MRQRDEAIQLVNKNHIAGTEVANAQAQVAILGAGVTRLTAEFSRQEEILRRHKVLAPFSGVVSTKFVEIGQWVETSTALVELHEIDHLWVEIPVPQTHFASVQVGTPVVMQFDALPSYALDALVSTRIPVGNNLARTFPVRIDIDNKQRLIALGMSVRVRVFANRSEYALVLPLDAIVRDINGAQAVWRVVENEGVTTGVEVVIQTGRGKGDMIEVASGALHEGDTVIINGNERLAEGQVIEEIQPDT